MRRNLPAFLVSVLCALALVFSACDSGGGGGGGGGSSSPSPASLKVPLPSNDARSGSYTSGDAASYLVSISSSKHSDSKSGTPGAVVEFVNIPVGTYAVKVEAKNSNGNTIATATSTATVSGGSSSSVSLKLTPLEYYEVKFMDDGGNVVTQMRVTVGDEFTLPKCDLKAPDGLKFSQWGVMNSDGIKPIASEGESYKPKNDIEFYAVWIDKDAHTIRYENILETDTVAGDTTRPTSFKETDNVTLPNMVRAGYTFDGWYLASNFSGSSINSWNPNTYTDDVTLYAKWTVITYTITYDLDGGTNATDNPPSFTVVDLHVSLSDPTKTGYAFDGWYTGRDATGAFTGESIESITVLPESESITLYAKWTIVNYNIDYHLPVGVTTTNPETYSINSSAITLSAPTRTGYTFVNWYDNEDCTGNPVAGIPAGSTENKDFYAKWTPIKYKIYLTPNGDTVSPATVATPTIENCAYDTDINLNATDKIPTRFGYAFKGWDTDQYATTARYPYTAGQPSFTVKNLKDTNNAVCTLYAVWAGSSLYNQGSVNAIAIRSVQPFPDGIGNCTVQFTTDGSPNAGCYFKPFGSGFKLYNSFDILLTQGEATGNIVCISGSYLIFEAGESNYYLCSTGTDFQKNSLTGILNPSSAQIVAAFPAN